jgi:hypothetical protein
MTTSNPDLCIIAIRNSKSPVKSSNGSLVWSVEVVFEGETQLRQIHDPVRIMYSSYSSSYLEISYIMLRPMLGKFSVEITFLPSSATLTLTNQ